MTHRRDAAAADGAERGRAFRRVLWRDIFVTGREFVPFLLQVVLQPFFLLFVFGKVLGELGYVTASTPTCCCRADRAHRVPHRPADHRVPAGHRLLVHQGDRGPAARAAAHRPRRGREDRLLDAAGLVAALVMFPISWWVLGLAAARVVRRPCCWSLLPGARLAGRRGDRA